MLEKGVTDQSSLHDPDTYDRLLDTKTTNAFIPMSATINTQTDQDNDIVTNVIPAVAAVPPTSYLYQPGDSRRQRTDPNGYTNNYAEGADHRLMNSNLDNFQYVADGTRSMDGTRHYDVDVWGRIVKIYDQASPQTLAISYDGVGRPIILDDGVNPQTVLAYFGMDLWQEGWMGAPPAASTRCIRHWEGSRHTSAATASSISTMQGRT